MATYVRRRCPICGAAVEPHCKSSPYCHWYRCPRFACRAVLSYRLGRGAQYLHGGLARSFTFVDLHTDPGG